MANLNDVHSAQNGPSTNSKITETINESLHIADGNDDKEFYVFKLVDSSRNGGRYIPNTDDVVNPKTGRVERVRLLAGIDTIWMKEQKDLTPEYVKQNIRNLVFPRGAKILRIPGKDKTALEFARICKHNVKDPKHKTGSLFEFYEYDPAKQQKDALLKEEFEIEMAIKAKEQSVEAMRKHANFLQISAVDEFGMPKTDEGIRREYIVAAKRNPELFKKTLGSAEVELSYLVKKAIEGSLIVLGGADGSASWGSGGMIGKIPVRVAPVKYLVDLALTNSEEGRKFKEQLQASMK